MNPKNYRPDIDGLRGIAVAAVVLFHLHVGLTGGYVGVDVFFVISGFLITRLILQAQDEQRFSLRDFWMRRVRRLAPAAMVVLLASLIAGAWLMYPRDFYYFTKSTIAQIAFASNIHFADYLDYFAGPAERHPLLHTWSLAVEEQFYVIFPVLLVAARKCSRRQLTVVLGAIATASFALSTFQVQVAPIKAFFLLPSRSWELMIGGLLALAPSVAPQVAARRWIWETAIWETVSALGLASLALTMFLYSNTTVFPGPAALAPCLATAAIIYANSRHATWVSRLLSYRGLVGLGLISYSLYLWHWPILSFSHYVLGETLTGTVALACAAASLACGWLSWKYIELPFRQRRIATTNPVLLRWAVACSAVVIAVSVVSLVTRGLPSRWGVHVAKTLANSGNTMSKYRRSLPDHVTDGRLPLIGDRERREPPSVLIWGDSHAAAAGDVCDELARRHGIHGYVAARGGCIPLLGTWRLKLRDEVVPWNTAVVEFVRRQQIQHVILMSRWSANIQVRPNGLKDALLKDAQSAEHTSDDAERVVRDGLRRTVAALNQAGAKVWVLKQTPDQPGDPLRLLIRAQRQKKPAWGVSRAEHLAQERRITAIFESIENVTVVDAAQHCFDNSGKSLIGTPESSYYSDPSHLSSIGCQNLLAPALEPVFAAIAAETRLARSPKPTSPHSEPQTR